ncbi:MAG: hypothetical protein J6X66_12755, partial [Lachnospiraceae bacterium]|nr:hypothetical protein [Lachnospiraceae bacterium]
MKKRIISIILAGTMVMSMAACTSSGGDAEPTGVGTPDPETPVTQDTYEGDHNEIEGGNAAELEN